MPEAELSHALITYSVNGFKKQDYSLSLVLQSFINQTSSSYVLKTGVLDGLRRVDVHVRHGGLVHKGAKAHA